jgi:23S rRNA (cytidine1920-2'-O)/16S rRNA (cytidine1409-2'-O)-methyltransferase
VDVGTAQIHDKIKNDMKVSVFENTDIRNFDTKNTYDIIVCDASFINLSMILDNIIAFGSQGCHYFLLIKPQFEVGKGNTKKGIVKDVELVQEILASYVESAQSRGLQNSAVYPSHLPGGCGNQEYFLYGIKNGNDRVLTL